MPFEGTTGERLRKALLTVAVLLGVYLAVQSLVGIEGIRYVGTGVAATNTINASGHGELLAVPDVATFTFSVVSDKTTVAAAQTDATAKANTITDYLKAQGIDAKDIQTTDYSVAPQYEYQTAACPVSVTSAGSGVASPASISYCPPGKQVLTGYEVRQTTTIKVHDTAKAGDLLAGVGAKGATEVSSLNFTFDDPTGVQQQARDKAIADAKQKAQKLADSLGVTLVRVVSFNENTSGYAPVAYDVGSGVMSAKAAAAPQISTGQNKVQDDVSITYEIR